jgi:putative DNA primase/helicase
MNCQIRKPELAEAVKEANGGRDPSCDDEAVIAQLAALSPLDYQRQRLNAAQNLDITVQALDKVVRAAKPHSEPPLFKHWEVEPSGQPVDAEHLITQILGRIRSHVVMTDEAERVVTLWTVMTWVHGRAAVHSPILLVTSPEPNSGKSTLLGVLTYLVRCSLPSVGITAAPLYRSIEKWQPTIIVDEGDTAFVNNDDLRAVVNSGWTRGTGVIRCESETNEPRLFSTFCPKAIGMKGRKLPETTMSRAIVIEMARKKPGERAIDFQYVDDDGLVELRSKLARFAADSADRLRMAEPALPQGFENRRAANWRLLLAIADTAGDEWGRKARAAAEKISRAAVSDSAGTDLLTDVKKAFDSKTDIDCILSRQLVELLTADPESRWCEWGRDRKPITQKQLAGLLREFHIISTTVHPADQAHGKGYRRLDFEDAWRRYLSPETPPQAPSPPFEACKRASADEVRTSSGFRSVQEKKSARFENANLSNNHAGLHACTLREPESGGMRMSSPHIPTEEGTSDDLDIPASLRRCAQCNAPGDDRGQVIEHDNHVWLWLKDHAQ